MKTKSIITAEISYVVIRRSSGRTSRSAGHLTAHGTKMMPIGQSLVYLISRPSDRQIIVSEVRWAVISL